MDNLIEACKTANQIKNNQRGWPARLCANG